LKRGLVIGNFCPLHQGHLALFRFAASNCDELIVSMSYRPGDPIDGAIRFFWIRETLKDQPNIKPEMVLDDFDNETLPTADRLVIWKDFINRKFPKIDVLFSGEEFDEPLARQLGVPHCKFEKRSPVSSTLIREKPFRYWESLPEIVRPYFVKKICLFGPESTGKSTLAKRLAEAYHTGYVPEVAREVITSNDFSVEDIIHIGHGQTQRIIEKEKTADKLLFCDTDLITTQIYSQYYLHQVPPVLYELERKVKYDFYFLLNNDVPWVADGLRDLRDNREFMFSRFKSALEERKISFVEVGGDYIERERFIRDQIDRLLGDLS
jgi:HTH-type transcriptional repressor of NAD biosynthesis genes